MVNGQGNLPYSDMTFGLGSYARSGCALIAVYNAMQLIQQPQSLQAVTDEIFWEHGMIAFGAGGVAPWSLESYFTAHQVAFTSYSSSRSTLEYPMKRHCIHYLNNKHNIFKGWHAMTALITNGKLLGN